MSRRLLDGKHPTPGPGANPGGRPSKLEITPQLINNICTAVRIGAYFKIAAAMNGIGYSTLRYWVTRGVEEPESLYGAFLEQLNKAIAESEIRDLAVIDSFANGRDAVYEYEPSRDELGQLLRDRDGEVIMVIARDASGNPIIKRSEIKPTWTASAWKLERRAPARWGRYEKDKEDALPLPDEAPEEKQAVSTEEYQRTLETVKDMIRDEELLGEETDD